MKRILVTGANKGIGLATVRRILETADDTFVYLGTRSLERGQSAADELLAANPGWSERLEVLQIDVSSDDSVTAAAATVDAELYGIVNNAGIGRGHSDRDVVNVNTYGPRRVVEAFLPKLQNDGRIVNVSSASGPNYVADRPRDEQALLTNPDVTWAEIDSYLDERLDAQSYGGNAYGLSKACLNAYTLLLARTHPNLTVNACTPGFIETDMTRSYATDQGKSPADLGMKKPEAGTKASLHLLLGDVGASGWYFGSDAVRSPLDRYRSPGDPPYEGD